MFSFSIIHKIALWILMFLILSLTPIDVLAPSNDYTDFSTKEKQPVQEENKFDFEFPVYRGEHYDIINPVYKGEPIEIELL